MRISDLEQGLEIKNKQLCEIFKCSPQGGMRRSHETNSLVLVSDHTKSFYEDSWDDDVFYYTGMGLTGDQNIEFMQNKTLGKSRENNIDVYLFEVFKPGFYVYQGKVELSSTPQQEVQFDYEGNKRKVWIFPLKLKNQKEPIAISEKKFKEKEEKKERKTRKISMEELAKRVAVKTSKKKTQKVLSERCLRNLYVVEYVKRRSQGICDLCERSAPFKDKNDIPFLEVHHIQWLSRNGKDSVDNAVALCPNCHRKMHILDRKADRKKLLLKAKFPTDD